jgi:hypothetical protein
MKNKAESHCMATRRKVVSDHNTLHHMERYTSFEQLKAAEESASTSAPVNSDADEKIIAALAAIRDAVVQIVHPIPLEHTAISKQNYIKTIHT